MYVACERRLLFVLFFHTPAKNLWYPGKEIVYTVKPLHNGHLGDKRKWPLWRGGVYGGVLRQFFLGSTTCFLVLNSCLLCPIITVIQSYIISRDKMLKILELCLESKYQSDKTSKVRSHYLTHHTKIISSTP